MSKVAENIINAVKRTKKTLLTQEEIFKLVLYVTKENENKFIESGDIKLNRTNLTISINGKNTRVEKLTFNLLEYLIQNENKFIPREQILRDVWGTDVYVNRTLDVCICKIRNIIGKEKIETLKKVGYKFSNKQNGKKD
jgi:two-component system, OmpR family, alkaline phosphatase synthesis response regulator PhoP